MASLSGTMLKNAGDLDLLIEKIGNSRIVLLGEASHGTHEYYTWRSAISKRLISEKGFGFIAVEGDWPDCYRVNRYVKGLDSQDKKPVEVLSDFHRWPTWMWANWEIASLVTWLREYNQGKRSKCGFYGLDVYSLWESMESLLKYLRANDPAAAKIAEKAIDCFSGYEKNEQNYAVNSLSAPCIDEVSHLLREIKVKAPTYNHDPEAELNTVQNASVAVEAEKYYRKMMSFGNETWNIRDTHMMDTLNRLLKFHGPSSRAVIWEHNTHVGDARYTSMAAKGMHNVGRLARQQYPGNSYIIGFGSFSGTVLAGEEWGSDMKAMKVPDAWPDSIEGLLHAESAGDRLLFFDEQETVRPEFTRSAPHRAIGVVYDPENEVHNYVPTILSKRYDAFIYLDRTTAIHPLHPRVEHNKVPDTYPFEF